MTDFRRKLNRLARVAYIGRRWYFVTVCTGARLPLFQNRDLAYAVLETLERACLIQRFEIYAYCFMPDHLHIELAALSEDCDLGRLMRDFKGRSATEVRGFGVRGLWQKGYYDHVLREADGEESVAWYIFNNSVRRGLTRDARDWPLSGSHAFDWKKAMAPAGKFVPSWKQM